jgi:hypothetical protein
VAVLGCTPRFPARFAQGLQVIGHDPLPLPLRRRHVLSRSSGGARLRPHTAPPPTPARRGKAEALLPVLLLRVLGVLLCRPRRPLLPPLAPPLSLT